MSNHVPGFQSFLRVIASFCMAKLATSSIRVNVGACHVVNGSPMCHPYPDPKDAIITYTHYQVSKKPRFLVSDKFSLPPQLTK